MHFMVIIIVIMGVIVQGIKIDFQKVKTLKNVPIFGVMFHD